MSLVFVYLILGRIDLYKMAQIISDANLLLVITAFALTFITFLMWTWLWKILLDIYGIHYSLWRLFQIFLIGFFAGSFMPGNLGTFVTVLYLRADGHSVRRSILTIFLRLLTRLVTTVVFGLASMFVFPVFTVAKSTLGAFFLLCLCVGIVIISYKCRRAIGLIVKQPIDSYLLSKARKLAIVDIGKLYADLHRLTLGQIIYVSGIAVVIKGIEFFTLYLMALSVHTRLSFWAVTACMSVMVVVTMFPVSLSGLGPREATLVFLFSVLDESSELAIAVSLLILLNIIVWRIIGMFAWIRLPVSLRKQTASMRNKP